MCARFVERAEAAGLEPIFLTQVHRDEDQHDRLADELGVRHLAWGSRLHADQLKVVEETFQSAGAVFSNRLHSLVLGARHGAVPIALREKGHDKLEATLGPVLSYVDCVDLNSGLDGLDEKISTVFTEVEMARRRIVSERDVFIEASLRSS
jgi:hypothetical protein